MDTTNSQDANAASSKAERKLALKRIRDRRSQQAMRDRQKREIISLREQVAQLSQLVGVSSDALPAASSSPPGFLSRNPQRPAAAGSPVNTRQHGGQQPHRNPMRQTEAPGYVSLISPGASPNDRQNSFSASPPVVSPPTSHLGTGQSRSTNVTNGNKIIIGSSVLQTWSARTYECTNSSLRSPTLAHRDARSSLHGPLVLSERHDSFPQTISPPTCPADRIMQPFIDKNRQYLASLRQAQSSSEESDSFYRSEVDKIRGSITNIATDILATYVEMQTLPKKIACLFSITKILNWLVFQTREAFDDMPVWLHPCQAQLEVPHPAWIDRVQWPRAREYLVHHQEISFDEYTTAFLSFDLNWVYNEEHTLVAETMTTKTETQSFVINPVFEEHIRNIGNWTVGRRYWQLYPDVAKRVEEDIKQFKSLSIDRQYWALLNS